MKYDELTAYKGDVTIPVYGTIADAQVYLKKDVDEAIAELKEFAEDACIERDDNQTAIDELQYENASLKAKLDKAIAERDGNQVCIDALKQKLESVQASMYADVVDANMENRRLKRALWMAMANRADGEFIYWCARLAMESGFTKADIRGYSVNTKRKLRTIGEWIEVWKNVKSKCRAKAEEYKR